MSIFIYFENESTWPVSPETLTVHVVTQLLGGDTALLVSPLNWGAAPGARSVQDILFGILRGTRGFGMQQEGSWELRGERCHGGDVGTAQMGRAGAAHFIYCC